MISSLLYALVALLIIGVIAYACRALLPEPFAKVAQVVCIVFAVIVLIYTLVGLVGGSSTTLAVAGLG